MCFSFLRWALTLGCLVGVGFAFPLSRFLQGQEELPWVPGTSPGAPMGAGAAPRGDGGGRSLRGGMLRGVGAPPPALVPDFGPAVRGQRQHLLPLGTTRQLRLEPGPGHGGGQGGGLGGRGGLLRCPHPFGKGFFPPLRLFRSLRLLLQHLRLEFELCRMHWGQQGPAHGGFQGLGRGEVKGSRGGHGGATRTYEAALGSLLLQL